MSENRRYSLVAPLLLILVGGALLLNQLGIWHLDWSAIWRYWPAVLILIGIEILLGRTRLGNALTLLIGAAVVVAVLFYTPVASFEAERATETYAYPLTGAETATIHLGVSVARSIGTRWRIWTTSWRPRLATTPSAPASWKSTT